MNEKVHNRQLMYVWQSVFYINSWFRVTKLSRTMLSPTKWQISRLIVFTTTTLSNYLISESTSFNVGDKLWLHNTIRNIVVKYTRIGNSKGQLINNIILISLHRYNLFLVSSTSLFLVSYPSSSCGTVFALYLLSKRRVKDLFFLLPHHVKLQLYDWHKMIRSTIFGPHSETFS